MCHNLYRNKIISHNLYNNLLFANLSLLVMSIPIFLPITILCMIRVRILILGINRVPIPILDHKIIYDIIELMLLNHNKFIII